MKRTVPGTTPGSLPSDSKMLPVLGKLVQPSPWGTLSLSRWTVLLSSPLPSGWHHLGASEEEEQCTKAPDQPEVADGHDPQRGPPTGRTAGAAGRRQASKPEARPVGGAARPKETSSLKPAQHLSTGATPTSPPLSNPRPNHPTMNSSCNIAGSSAHLATPILTVVEP